MGPIGSRSECRRRSLAQGYTVFISHSARDSWVAGIIADRIRELGGEAWLDVNELAAGDPLYARILNAVDTCDEAVVLLSPYSLRSQWVLFEIGVVCGQHKRITPILVHVEPDAIPIIPGVRGVDLNQIDQLFLPELEKRITAKGAPGVAEVRST